MNETLVIVILAIINLPAYRLLVDLLFDDFEEFESVARLPLGGLSSSMAEGRASDYAWAQARLYLVVLGSLALVGLEYGVLVS